MSEININTILNRFNAKEEQEEIAKEAAASRKYLTFLIDNQFYGFQINDVKEIIEMQEITPVPEFPDYAKGIINLRGLLIPVIDVRMRFCKNEAEYNERTCIIILNIRGTDVGYIVDTVDEVMDIDSENISAVPKLSDVSTRKFIEGVGKTPNKIVMLLSAKKMLNDEEVKNLDIDSDITINL